MTEQVLYAELGDENALAAALTAKSPIGRSMARGVASGWPHTLTLWFNDEINRPNGKPSVALQALMLLQIQTLGSFIAGLTRPEDSHHVVKLYAEMVADRLPSHVAKCHEHGGKE